ncbi:hypothetical protein BY458DRAFT_528133 [Sporodiniella umbellata]|nr:hypothetical protein BY458DRAFT_528133 [Sporodiniella umbellata]
MLTDKHSQEFNTNGYTILLAGLSSKEVEDLCNESDELTNYLMSEGRDLLKDLGCIVEPWTCGYLDQPQTNAYKTNIKEYKSHRDSILPDATISNIVLNKYSMWASQLLRSETVYLLNEQYIVKPPKTCSDFDWHKDSDYYRDRRVREKCSIACWTALNDVNELNGTLVLQDHTLVDVPAGSIVFMSSHLLHKSTGNKTSLFRRAFMPQFSTEPFVDLDKPHLPLSERCLGLAINCHGKG